MDIETILKLNNLNKTFYQITAKDFDDSRQYYWQGWDKLLPTIRGITPSITERCIEPVEMCCQRQRIEGTIKSKKMLNVLDLGCGNARFAKFLSENLAQKFKYTGLDNSKDLLKKAEETCNLKLATCNFREIDIIQALLDKTFTDTLENQYNLIVLFGVIHHIPSFDLRKDLIRKLLGTLTRNGILVFTSWQFAKEKRFRNRIIEPDVVEIEKKELEENDYILDWRRGERAYRYCHFLDEEEIKKIVKKIPKVKICKQFYADGKSQKLNLYTVLKNHIILN